MLKSYLFFGRRILRHTPLFCCSTMAVHIFNAILYVWIYNYSFQFVSTVLADGRPFGDVCLFVLACVGFLLVCQTVTAISTHYVEPLAREKLESVFKAMVLEKAAAIDISAFDDHEFYNDVFLISKQVGQRCFQLVQTVGFLLRGVLIFTLIVRFMAGLQDYLGLVLVFLSFGLSLATDLFRNKRELAAEVQRQPGLRKAAYANKVFSTADHAKELRLFQVSDSIVELYRQGQKQSCEILARHGPLLAALEVLHRFLLSDAVLYIVYPLTLCYRMLVSQTVPIGEFAALFFAFRGIRSVFDLFKQFIPALYQHHLYLTKILAFLQHENQVTSLINPAPLTASLQALSVEGITFGYPGHPPVLRGLSLEIKPGSKIAIVGENGAGKSTLANLLLRLYDVDGGAVRYGAVDIRSYDLEQYRRKFGCVFQTHNLYALTLLENISMNTVSRSSVEDALRALTQSDPEEEIWNKRSDLMVGLTREFDENGIYLSGGQAQKLAFARVLYAGRDILVLDEPSSSLDPIAEADLHDMIFQATEQTVIVISHRLSATREADCIFLVDEGCVLEQGSHAELMELQGKYAAMFRRQQEMYLFTKEATNYQG